jgi:L-iditol 2-dehydrogenase
MKALLLSEYKHLDVADLPAPIAGPGEVLVRVAACGICGSDVHGYDGSSGRRIPPIVMGHEAAGIVAGRGTESPSIPPSTAASASSAAGAR